MTAFQPVLTILAGPNGSGKTTLFERLNPPGEQVNADRIARLINPFHPEAASVEAARATLLRLSQLIGERQNFSYETTLSGRQPLTLIQKARLAGYRIELAYITLEDVALNLLRVRQRVLEGGIPFQKPTSFAVMIARYSTCPRPSLLRMKSRYLTIQAQSRSCCFNGETDPRQSARLIQPSLIIVVWPRPWRGGPGKTSRLSLN